MRQCPALAPFVLLLAFGCASGEGASEADGLGFEPTTRASTVHTIGGLAEVLHDGAVRVRGPGDTSLTVQTEQIQRGGVPLATPGARSVSASDDAVEVVWDAEVAERLEPLAQGVEQSWRFASRPRGEGALEVRVAVDGELLAANATGHYFRGEDGGTFRYGNATWIDADGVRSAVPAALDGGSLVLTVPAALVDESAYPAVLDPTIGPEMPVDRGATTAGVGTSDPTNLAFDGTHYLMTFADAGAPMGLRLDMDGWPVESAPFPVPEGLQTACIGTTCARLDFDYPSGGITLQRFRSDGTIIDVDPVLVASDAQGAAWLLTQGSHFVVVSLLDDPTTGRDVFTIRLDATSGAVDAAAHQLAFAGNDLVYQVACGPSICLALLSSGFVHFDPATGFVESAPLGGSSGTVALAYGDGEFVSTNGVRYPEVGGVLGPGIGGFYGSNVQCTATHCLAGTTTNSFSSNRHLLVNVLRHGASSSTLIAMGGIQSGSNTTILSGPNLVCGSASCLAVWYERVPESSTYRTYGPYARRISTSGVPEGGITGILGELADQHGPAMAASDMGESLVAWQSSRREAVPAEIYGARISATTGTLDPNARLLQTLASGTGNHLDDVTFGAHTYYVVHTVQTSTSTSSVASYLSRVASDGRLLDPDPIRLGTGVLSPVNVAFGDDVVFTAFSVGAIVGRRYNIVGAALELEAFAVSETGSGSSPDVAFDGERFLVVWSENRGRGADVFGRRVSPSGELLDPLSLPIGSEALDQRYPSVAGGAGGFLVAWHDGRGYGSHVYATRVTGDGEVLDLVGIPIRSAEVVPTSVRVAWDGASYVVAWVERERHAGPTGALEYHTIIAAARVTPTGVVLDPAPWVISDTVQGVGGGVALSAPATATSLIAYERYVEADDVRRVFTARFENDGPGAPCSDASDCEGDFCVDGVCCNSRCDGACEACSIATGATFDGFCGPAAGGTVCRGAGPGACDVDEVCDGESTACPPDIPMCDGAADAGPSPTGTDAGPAPIGTDAGPAPIGTDAGPAPTGIDAGPAPATDAGAPATGIDAGIASGADAGTGSGSGSGCHVSGAAAPRGSLTMVLLGLAFLVARRRRR